MCNGIMRHWVACLMLTGAEISVEDRAPGWVERGLSESAIIIAGVGTYTIKRRRQPRLRSEAPDNIEVPDRAGKITLKFCACLSVKIGKVRGRWREVVRVNAKTVGVSTDYSWTDTSPYAEIQQVIPATEIAAAKAKQHAQQQDV